MSISCKPYGSAQQIRGLCIARVLGARRVVAVLFVAERAVEGPDGLQHLLLDRRRLLHPLLLHRAYTTPQQACGSRAQRRRRQDAYWNRHGTRPCAGETRQALAGLLLRLLQLQLPLQLLALHVLSLCEPARKQP